jgi:hypothetical protein
MLLRLTHAAQTTTHGKTHLRHPNEPPSTHAHAHEYAHAHVATLTRLSATSGNHDELMAQLEREAHGALETREISKLFTCMQAAEVPNDGHRFATTWSEPALAAAGFDPVPPPKAPRTARPGSHSSASWQRNPSHCAHRAGEGVGRVGGVSSGSPTPTRAHRQSPASTSSFRSRPGTTESRRVGGRGDGWVDAGGGADEERKGYLKAEDCEVAPVMRYLEQRTRLEVAALEIEHARLMAHGDAALTARARLESGVDARGGSTRRKPSASVGALGSTYIDVKLQELRDAERASKALEEAVEEDRGRAERDRERMRLKRIRLRNEWLQSGVEQYGRVAERLQEHEEQKQQRLQQNALRAKRKLQMTLAWSRVGFTYVRRTNAAEALRQDRLNEAMKAIFEGVNAHIERRHREDVAARQLGREHLRYQMTLRNNDYAHARQFLKAAVVQRAVRCRKARHELRRRQSEYARERGCLPPLP